MRYDMAPGGIELRRENDADWRLWYQGRSLRLRHAKGLAYLSTLLTSPRQPIPATALAGNDPDETDLMRIESDRLKVTKSIKAVLRRIAQLDPEAGYYLRAAVHTGRRCSYEPPPGES